MAHAKNKKFKRTKGSYSSNLHTSKSRMPIYTYPFVKKIVLSIILIATIIVVVAAVTPLFYNKQKSVESQISSLATDYYENYFYKNLSSSEDFTKIEDLDSAMEKYRTHGFAAVTLRQLLLYDNQKNANYTDFLTKYCDENSTSVRFYPEPPYDKTSYHAEYTYSCAF